MLSVNIQREEAGSAKPRTFFVTVVLLLAIGSTLSQESWRRLNSPTTETLRRVYFVDSLYGWASGDAGTIIRTTNGGDSWTLQETHTDDNIIDIHFINRNVGWAIYWRLGTATYGTNIMRTTNGGQLWTVEEYPEDNVFLNRLRFLDSLNGWMGGGVGRIVKTTDGGATWKRKMVDSSQCAGFPIVDLGISEGRMLFTAGGHIDIWGVMWRSTNGGESWQASCVAPEPVYSIHVFDSLRVLGVGGDFEYGASTIRTSNGGVTWHYQVLDLFGVGMGLSFRTPSEGWATLGFAEELIFTLDAGITWHTVPVPGEIPVYDLSFPDSLHGYGVGDLGIIIKYVSTPPVAVKEEQRSVPEGFRLDHVFPNPFNPTAHISYSVPRATHVSIRVSNVLGQIVATLVDEEKSFGTYRLEFDGQELPSGVYFLTMRAGRFQETRKLLLVR